MILNVKYIPVYLEIWEANIEHDIDGYIMEVKVVLLGRREHQHLEKNYIYVIRGEQRHTCPHAFKHKGEIDELQLHAGLWWAGLGRREREGGGRGRRGRWDTWRQGGREGRRKGCSKIIFSEVA